MLLSCYSMLNIALVLIAASGAWAARPLATEDAGIVPSRAIEVEFGSDLTGCRDGSREHGLGGVIKGGLTGRLDVGLGVPYRLGPESGWCPAQMSLKFAIWERGNSPGGLSLMFSHCVGHGEYRLCGIASRELGSLRAHLNVSHEVPGEEGRGVSGLAAALELPAGRNFELVQEVAAEGDVMTSLSGARWSASNALAFDAGVGFGLNSSSPRVRTTAGLTVRL